jgi:hypothetical protein
VAQLRLVGIVREGDAVHRADVDAGITLDAQIVGEHGLHVAVQAALRLTGTELAVEAQLYLHLDVRQALSLSA